jgi:fumarylpyruvate hydrolase
MASPTKLMRRNSKKLPNSAPLRATKVPVSMIQKASIRGVGFWFKVFGYGVGIDFTRRDLQADAKKQGRPWDTAKGFDFSGPVSALIPVSKTGWLDKGAITLSLNGQPRQRGDLSDMIWKVDEIIAELSTYYTLKAGDVIFTGTPAGVGAANQGDEVDAAIEGVGRLVFTMV